MKCTKCNKNNIKKANYCKYCGNKFSEKEKKEAKSKGIIANIRKFESWYNKLTLKCITDSTIFKVLLLILIIFLGVLNLTRGNVTFHILESDKYEIKYNEVKNEYYIILNNNGDLDNYGKVSLDLYIPNKVNNINVIKYNEKDEEINNTLYSVKDEISVYANTIENEYYILKTDVNRSNEIKVYIYLNNNQEEV